MPNKVKNNFNLSRGDIVYITAKVEKRINEYQLVINRIEKC